jgi:hypothetical protein
MRPSGSGVRIPRGYDQLCLVAPSAEGGGVRFLRWLHKHHTGRSLCGELAPVERWPRVAARDGRVPAARSRPSGIVARVTGARRGARARGRVRPRRTRPRAPPCGATPTCGDERRAGGASRATPLSPGRGGGLGSRREPAARSRPSGIVARVTGARRGARARGPVRPRRTRRIFDLFF